ncbi:mitochondrial carrier domain-containing protein [Lobosporangium transversale]|uniref:Mitochondrial carrier domain-containing protein n=1 Tax=Lobosporangium transversale TaxID=64571 RepID=A0A1Y2H3N5_9FUNG|nr:mitochondrial carrier domain-containing protein [Lobosporangium transversale]ORZ27682.1 mitochondrial carrier domain-containing protein [Lobosporangium transversale]|eukprot:XP_021885385.1 mitochondrial carrier domain-containing protein [Lobosporangium transversale]
MTDRTSIVHIKAAESGNDLGDLKTTIKNPQQNKSGSDVSTRRSSIAAGAPTLSKTETVLCGATAGVVSRFVIAPLDVVKIRLQMQTQRKDLSTILRRTSSTKIEDALISNIGKQQQPKYRGMFTGMALIVREEGIRGLWKGNMAAEYLYLTYSGIQFLVYQQTKVILNKTAELSTQQAASATPSSTTGSLIAAPFGVVSKLTSSAAVQSSIAGANAGIIATACTYPFDLLRTRFAVQRDVKVYTGIIQACKHIYRADGIPGFYRGMSPALIQVIPYMGIMFGSYDTLKRIAPAGQFLLGLEDLLCGGLSGVISKTGVYPLDMVRKRLQIQGSEQLKSITKDYSPPTGTKLSSNGLPSSVWKCMVHIARTEGYLALYKGLLPGLVKAAPASAVTFLVFSQAGSFVEKFRQRP